MQQEILRISYCFADSVYNLTKELERYLEKGYQPFGNIIKVNDILYQQIVKYKKYEEKQSTTIQL